MNLKTVKLMSVADFFNFFYDVVPEGVGLNEFLETISDSEVSFGNNTDTLLTVYEAYTFLSQAVPDNFVDVVADRYDLLVQEIYEKQHYSKTEVFVSLGC